MTDNSRKMTTLDDIERRHVVEHFKPYFDWLRHIVTISLAALTALVALQGQYIPRQPALLEFLAVTWVSLLFAICLGLLSLREEHQGHIRAIKHLRHLRATLGDEATGKLIDDGASPPPNWRHRWIVRLMLISFLCALSSLCVFAVTNLGRLHQP